MGVFHFNEVAGYFDNIKVVNVTSLGRFFCCTMNLLDSTKDCSCEAMEQEESAVRYAGHAICTRYH